MLTNFSIQNIYLLNVALLVLLSIIHVQSHHSHILNHVSSGNSICSLQLRQIAAGSNKQIDTSTSKWKKKKNFSKCKNFQLQDLPQKWIFHKQNPPPSHDSASMKHWSCNITPANWICPCISKYSAITSSTTHQSSFHTLTSEQVKQLFYFLVFLYGLKQRWILVSTVLLLCQTDSNFHRATVKATDSVCDQRVTLALIVFTQAGNVLMVTPTIVRTRGVSNTVLCCPDGTHSSTYGHTHLHAVYAGLHANTCILYMGYS